MRFGFFFFQAEDGIRDIGVTGVQTCALPICPRPEAPHDRHVVTEAPNLMWAIDATRITTVQDGKIWLFGVAEHWNAELLGWHVAKSGNRFEATQALGMAVRQQFGRLAAEAAGTPG